MKLHLVAVLGFETMVDPQNHAFYFFESQVQNVELITYQFQAGYSCEVCLLTCYY